MAKCILFPNTETKGLYSLVFSTDEDEDRSKISYIYI